MPIPPTPSPSQNESVPNTPEPTEIPRNPFLFDNLDFSMEGPTVIEFSLEGSPIFVDFNLLPFKNDGSFEEVNHFLNYSFRPGANTAISVGEKYLNTIVYLHSGYINGVPLEAESLRAFIEGYSDGTILDNERISKKLHELEGQKVSIVKEGKLGEFTIEAASKIPHKYTQFLTKIVEIVDISSSFGVRNKRGFDYFRDNHGLLITFCGWGPEDASKNSQSPDYRYTYTQYVLGLKPNS